MIFEFWLQDKKVAALNVLVYIPLRVPASPRLRADATAVTQEPTNIAIDELPSADFHNDGFNCGGVG